MMPLRAGVSHLIVAGPIIASVDRKAAAEAIPEMSRA